MPKTLNESYELVDIALLKTHERNVNQGDFGKIQESVKENGFFGALVVQRSTNKILAGNHRYLVAKSEGFEKLPVTWVDVDDETALRILIVDNATARAGTDDESALAALLAELAVTDKGLLGTGFDGDDLDRLIADLSRPTDGDWGASLGGLPDGDKAPFQQMTFTLHDSQADAVTQAMEMSKDAGPFTGSPNENSNGNALDRIVTFYLTHARNR